MKWRKNDWATSAEAKVSGTNTVGSLPGGQMVESLATDYSSQALKSMELALLGWKLAWDSWPLYPFLFCPYKMRISHPIPVPPYTAGNKNLIHRSTDGEGFCPGWNIPGVSPIPDLDRLEYEMWELLNWFRWDFFYIESMLDWVKIWQMLILRRGGKNTQNLQKRSSRPR